jgi:uncharacterized membrane protein
VPEAPAPGREAMPEHEALTVEEVARVHREHEAAASGLQHGVDRVTRLIARPAMALGLIGAVGLWAGLALARGGGVAEPAFAWLELASTLLALITALLILVTQSREDQLAERRATLTLELALLADRRSAKIIALLEEMRRDAPGLANRVDRESDAMQTPADPKAVMEAVDARTGVDR